MNRETKKKIKTAGAVLFVLYILVLIYFLFFADRYGQMAFAEREYHYNLVLFTEIRRFWKICILLRIPIFCKVL